MEQQRKRLRMLIYSGMFAAVTAVFAQIEIPLPVVPISGQTLAVGITAVILGSRYGAAAMAVYAGLGAAGLPVFAEAKGGLHILAGPTGGYIIGFIAAAFATGWILEKTAFTFRWALAANIAGMLITLLFGTVWLKIVLNVPWDKAMAIGVWPFIAVGLIKAALASWIGVEARRRLVQARLLANERSAA
ncbi:biotin transporter BioY [Bacillus mangrovi]|uniref:Biotin transporter n=1 Tax=Metabacillus mangrovi TaxID=1491830 RepID=A0A7X2S4Z6_9BACI|nr:biotin transporter BioY [Metabacillus mangrovi]MTH53754.1 biotin transporter BioY [Metabacillus mangrovi]